MLARTVRLTPSAMVRQQSRMFLHSGNKSLHAQKCQEPLHAQKCQEPWWKNLFRSEAEIALRSILGPAVSRETRQGILTWHHEGHVSFSELFAHFSPWHKPWHNSVTRTASKQAEIRSLAGREASEEMISRVLLWHRNYKNEAAESIAGSGIAVGAFCAVCGMTGMCHPIGLAVGALLFYSVGGVLGLYGTSIAAGCFLLGLTFHVQVSPPALISTDAAELDVTVDAPDTAPDATIEDAPNNPAEHPRRAEP